MLFKIGHQVVSQTKAPDFEPIKDKHNSNLVDGPGINDTNFRHEYANQLGVKFILKNSNFYNILLIINSNEIVVSNGASFIELVTSITRKFKTDVAGINDTWDKFILPVFVKFNFQNARPCFLGSQLAFQKCKCIV